MRERKAELNWEKPGLHLNENKAKKADVWTESLGYLSKIVGYLAKR